MKPTAIDLFCGAGGLSQGFKDAGFNILWANDFVETFCSTYKTNHKKTKVLCKDIRDVSVENIKSDISQNSIDVVIGGPPCQGFSMAGKRDLKDPRNSLFMEFTRIVNGLKPKFVIMENVKGIMSMRTNEGKKVIDIIENEFKRIGYDINHYLLNAADFGIPQRRERVIFMGTRLGFKVTAPLPTHSKNQQKKVQGGLTKTWIPVKKVLISRKNVDKSFFHGSKMINGFKKRKQRHVLKGNGFGAQFLKMDEPSYTISARYWKDGADALVKYSEDEVRMITPLEAARIQSFSDNYKFIGNKREVYTQIGNAVPPMLARAVACQIKQNL
jgi:DNA (cytosine-5)-methyltransferase 1